MRIESVLALGAAFLVFTGCAADESRNGGSAAATDTTHGGHRQPNVITVVATDFAYDAPDTIPAGMTKFVMKGQGQQIHHATVVKLDSGKTADDLMAAFRTPGPPPRWATFIGGPNVPDPGKESNATLELTPGNYALVCFVDTPDKVPHFAKGMVQGFTVVPAPASAPPPNAHVTLVLTDYAFNFDKPLTAGRHTIKVENTAQQDHEIQLVKLAPGKTLADLQQWSMSLQGPPPGNAVGGTAGMKPGTVNYFDVDLTPGEYVAICYIPDSKDGKPHFVHGMMRQISVS